MPIACRKCRQPIGAKDPFCKHCGTRQALSEPVYHHPLVILLLGLFILGPFALGLIWRSQSMDRTMKIVLATIIVAYSAASIYALIWIGMAMYREFSVLNQLM